MRVYSAVLVFIASAFLVSEVPVLATTAEQSRVLSPVNFKGATQRFLRRHKESAAEEERGLDAEKLLKLLNADDIAAALKNYDDEVTLFAKWWPHEMDVVDKLMEMPNRIKNMPILTKFNNFRTTMHYDQALTPWLSTKQLDELAVPLRAFKMKPMTEQFAVWHKAGLRPKEFSEAIAKVENPIKRKGYGALDNHYKKFVEGEANKIAWAAAKKTEEFAAKKAQAKKIAEAAAKRAQEIKAQKEITKKNAEAAAKITENIRKRKALAKKIADAREAKRARLNG